MQPTEANLVLQLHNLRVFIAVAESNSIAGASERLYKAQSAVSRCITELERTIGTPLFERKPRGMMLNDCGKTVLMRAARIRDEIRLASEEFALASASAGGSPSAAAVIDELLFNGRKLELVIQLAALGNMAAVGAQLNITASGVSMALSRIEAVLGQPLFEQKVQGLIAIEATENLVIRAKRVMAELRHMGSDIAGLLGAISGLVVVGSAPLGRTYVMPNAISSAIKNHDGLRITAVDAPYGQLVRGLRSGDLDAVIAVTHEGDIGRGITVEHLFYEHLGIVVRADHPLMRRGTLEMSELLGEKWILPAQNAPAREQLNAYLAERKLKTPVSCVETADLAMIRQILRTSDLLAVIPPRQLMFEIETGQLAQLPVALTGVERNVAIMLREGAMMPPAVHIVLDAIRAQARALDQRSGDEMALRPTP